MTSGLLNALYMFDPSALLWQDLTSQILGTPPVVRYGHRLSIVGSNLCLFGGIGNTSEYILIFLALHFHENLVYQTCSWRACTSSQPPARLLGPTRLPF